MVQAGSGCSATMYFWRPERERESERERKREIEIGLQPFVLLDTADVKLHGVVHLRQPRGSQVAQLYWAPNDKMSNPACKLRLSLGV